MARRRRKASPAYSVDFAGIMPKKIGNRSGLRAAKTLGFLDAQAGQPSHPPAVLGLARSGHVIKNRGLAQLAYRSGHAKGERQQLNRYGVYLAGVRNSVQTQVKPVRRKWRGVVAKELMGRRRAGDTVTLTSYVRARGIGRNVGSFKNRSGQWQKGKGGRFVGSR